VLCLKRSFIIQHYVLKKRFISIQFMTQIFIKMSVNDATVKKNRNYQAVLSILYSKCSYKMEYYL